MNKPNDKTIVMTDEDAFSKATEQLIEQWRTDAHKAACFDEMLAALECAKRVLVPISHNYIRIDVDEKARRALRSIRNAMAKAKGGKA